MKFLKDRNNTEAHAIFSSSQMISVRIDRDVKGLGFCNSPEKIAFIDRTCSPIPENEFTAYFLDSFAAIRLAVIRFDLFLNMTISK
jgi:hypothetical protein